MSTFLACYIFHSLLCYQDYSHINTCAKNDNRVPIRSGLRDHKACRE